MCGIAGFIDVKKSFSKESLMAIAISMANAISHRGPNHQGVWVDEQQGVAFSHQRLSIIDCSPLGHQPMHSQNQRYCMVYNGEIYNFHCLRQDLLALGITFRGHSDSEILLEAFSCWGIDKTLEKINGMFAIALWDRLNHSLFLIRDRLGQKPIYYSQQESIFYFSSELKALCEHPQFKKNIDQNALAAYTKFNYVPAPLSIYKNVFKVLPSHYIQWHQKTGETKSVCYWDHQNISESAQQNIFKGSYEQAESELEKLLKDAVKMQMIADVPLGAFLSGGIDSSLIVSLMQAQSTQPVKTFTIAFQEKNYNEANEARAVASYLRTDHTELTVSPTEAQAVIPQLPKIFDEPFSDMSQIPTYLVSRLARQQVTVALSGDGGDEFFAGYNRHFWVPSLWKYASRFPKWFRLALVKLMTIPSPHFYNTLWRGPKNSGDKIYKLADILKNHHPSGMYLDLISSWKAPNEILLSSVNSVEKNYHDFFEQSNLDFVHQMMSLDARHYLPDDILVKVDRASMAVGLEARSPFMDYRVVEFAWHLSLSFKLFNHSGKRILKNILSKYLPKQLTDRPKMGFGIPMGEWMRGPLKEWAGDLLNSNTLKQQGYFKSDVILKKWNEHQSGRRNWQYCLWNILMFQSFLENQVMNVIESRDR